MGILRRRGVNTDSEQKMLIGLIVSTRFCNEILPMISNDLLQTDHSKIIVKWVNDYYKKYKECPSAHIRDIYDIEKANLKEADAEIIQTFLTSLSNKYENDDNFNDEYFIDSTVPYLQERSMLTTAKKVESAIESGRSDLAKKFMADYRQVSRKMSRWVNPFTGEFAEEVFQAKFGDSAEEMDSYLFRFPGILGEFLGHFERDWFVAFLGPMKRGKTQWLMETGIQGAFAGYNVVIFSLEMEAKGISSRLFSRLTARTRDSGLFIYPCFDCESNQDGSCTKRQRTNSVPLFLEGQPKPKYDPAMHYRVCTACRGVNGDFHSEVWFEAHERERITLNSMKSAASGFGFQWGNRIRLMSYPAYSANLTTIKNDLEELEYTDDFIPDIIIIDYADILAPEHGTSTDEQDRVDATWKSFKNLSAVKHALVVTASQSTRATLDKANVKGSDTGRDIRKLAHVDAMFTLNQTKEEKASGVIRIGTAAHRWRDFNELQQVKVLQQLSLGQVIVDSEY